MAAAKKSPRYRHLDQIMTKIATFLVTETYTDEPEAQRLLAESIRVLKKAQELLDEEAE